ncbi:DUF367 family protein [Acidianus sp.]|uniref:DUF367 family protein n=1 Tax=Acidianus sp. TaxID=1872104 RepID=UPI00397988D2
MKIFVIELYEDDPEKSTGRKMVRFGFAKYTEKPRGIVLNPLSEEVISIDDVEIVNKYGLSVIDSSWNKSDAKFYARFMSRFSRRLPLLFAGNPINYAKPYKLSSLEAVSASLYILNFIDISLKLLSLYKWGKTFYDLNKELLESYRGKNKDEIIEIEKSFLKEEPQQ